MTEHHQPTPESVAPVATLSDHEIMMLATGFALEHGNQVIKFARSLLERYAAPVAALAQPVRFISDGDRMELAGALGLLRGHRYYGCADALQRVLDADHATQAAPVSAADGLPGREALLGCAGVSRLHGDMPAIFGAADIERFANCVLKHFGQPSGNAGELPSDDEILQVFSDAVGNQEPDARFVDVDREQAIRIAHDLLRCYAAPSQPPVSQSLPYEQALFELIDKIDPGLDTGDLLADAATASKALSVRQASDPRTPSDMLVNGGALRMALNVLRRAGKTEVADELEKTAQQDSRQDRPLIARALADWHEDDGPVAWWAWCGHEWAGEPAWIGTPLCSDWPGYHTHWTAHPTLPEISARAATKEQS